MAYRIKIERHYYRGTFAPAARKAWVCGPDGFPMIFRRRKDAEAWIEANTKGPYYLDHGEYDPPTYHIRRAPAGA